MKKNRCHIPKQFLDKFIALELDLLWKNYGTMEKNYGTLVNYSYYSIFVRESNS